MEGGQLGKETRSASNYTGTGGVTNDDFRGFIQVVPYLSPDIPQRQVPVFYQPTKRPGLGGPLGEPSRLQPLHAGDAAGGPDGGGCLRSAFAAPGVGRTTPGLRQYPCLLAAPLAWCSADSARAPGRRRRDRPDDRPPRGARRPGRAGARADPRGRPPAACSGGGRAGLLPGRSRNVVDQARDLVGDLLDLLQRGTRILGQQSATDDVRRGVSTVGPHRDEVELSIDGLPSRTHASQGEQRTLALALRHGRNAVAEALQ